MPRRSPSGRAFSGIAVQLHGASRSRARPPAGRVSHIDDRLAARILQPNPVVAVVKGEPPPLVVDGNPAVTRPIRRAADDQKPARLNQQRASRANVVVILGQVGQPPPIEVDSLPARVVHLDELAVAIRDDRRVSVYFGQENGLAAAGARRRRLRCNQQPRRAENEKCDGYQWEYLRFAAEASERHAEQLSL